MWQLLSELYLGRSLFLVKRKQKAWKFAKSTLIKEKFWGASDGSLHPEFLLICLFFEYIVTLIFLRNDWSNRNKSKQQSSIWIKLWEQSSRPLAYFFSQLFKEKSKCQEDGSSEDKANIKSGGVNYFCKKLSHICFSSGYLYDQVMKFFQPSFVHNYPW